MTITEKSGLRAEDINLGCIDEKVIHIPEGVCIIEQICKIRNDDNIECEYYKLVPLVNSTSAVYVPVHSEKTHTRSLRSKKEICKILELTAKCKPVWEKNEQKRVAKRQRALLDDDGVTLAKLIKSYHHKKEKDHITILDSIWLKKAEQLLCSEIAEVLNVDYEVAIKKVVGN